MPTNPYDSVETLCNKDKFREFLKHNGFNAPLSEGYSTNDIDTSLFTLPVIIKPVDSSGSKGATVLRDWNGLEEACDFAFSFSRSHRIIVEEYIEKKHKYLIGGDIFVYNGKVILWGLLNCHRDSSVNPLVPVGKSYPLLLDEQDKLEVENTLQSMVDLKNEQETYEELNSHLPSVGDYVTTPEKLKGEVSSVNVLRQLVKVIVTLDGDEKEIREYPVSELRFKPKRKNDRMNIDDKELKELEELERKEGKAHINDD